MFVFSLGEQKIDFHINIVTFISLIEQGIPFIELLNTLLHDVTGIAPLNSFDKGVILSNFL